MISVYGDLKGENYTTFVSFAMEHSDAIMLTYHTFDHPLKKSVQEIRKKLKPFRVAYRDNSKSLKKGKPEIRWAQTISWTPTRIFVETYRLSPEVKEVVLSADDIFAWQYPKRPDDLSLFYQGECWVATTAHEKFFSTYDHEREVALMLTEMGIEYKRYPGGMQAVQGEIHDKEQGRRRGDMTNGAWWRNPPSYKNAADTLFSARVCGEFYFLSGYLMRS